MTDNSHTPPPPPSISLLRRILNMPILRWAGLLFTLIVIAWIIFGLVTGGNGVGVHLQDRGAERFDVCPESQPLALFDLEKAYRAWHKRECPMPPVAASECLSERQRGEIRVVVCATGNDADFPCLIGRQAYMVRDPANPGEFTHLVVGPGVTYDQIRHEPGHAFLSDGFDGEGHASQHGGWMSITPGDDFVGIDCSVSVDTDVDTDTDSAVEVVIDTDDAP